LDLLADFGEVAGCGRCGGLVEFELELGFAGAELFDGGTQSGQSLTDVLVGVVEGSFLEGGEVAVVPNGRSSDSPHYAYKIRWLAALHDPLAPGVATGAAVMVAGD
jgi:hypothetical protein